MARKNQSATATATATAAAQVANAAPPAPVVHQVPAQVLDALPTLAALVTDYVKGRRHLDSVSVSFAQRFNATVLEGKDWPTEFEAAVNGMATDSKALLKGLEYHARRAWALYRLDKGVYLTRIDAPLKGDKPAGLATLLGERRKDKLAALPKAETMEALIAAKLTALPAALLTMEAPKAKNASATPTKSPDAIDVANPRSMVATLEAACAGALHWKGFNAVLASQAQDHIQALLAIIRSVK